MKIAGIDEAGKGPVIGPMVVCGVSVDENNDFEKIGLKDSKKLSVKKREQFAEEIRKIAEVHLIKIESQKLDKLMEKKTINEILTDCYAEIINKLKADMTYVDSPDVIPERLGNTLNQKTGRKVKAAHKADELYPVVSAASIIAKVERDKEIEKIKKSAGDFGSGYASDERTIKFLKDYFRKHKKYPPYVRKSWKTLNRIQQQSLTEFY
jgi:ribonuclease HII